MKYANKLPDMSIKTSIIFPLLPGIKSCKLSSRSATKPEIHSAFIIAIFLSLSALIHSNVRIKNSVKCASFRTMSDKKVSLAWMPMKLNV